MASSNEIKLTFHANVFNFKNAFLLRFLILCSITLLKLKFILLTEIIGVLGLILLVEDPL